MNKRSKDTPQRRVLFFRFFFFPPLLSAWRNSVPSDVSTLSSASMYTVDCRSRSWGRSGVLRAHSLRFLHLDIKHKLTKVPSTLVAKYLAVEN